MQGRGTHTGTTPCKDTPDLGVVLVVVDVLVVKVVFVVVEPVLVVVVEFVVDVVLVVDA